MAAGAPQVHPQVHQGRSEHDDADDQQVEQSLGDRADDAQHDRGNDEDQETSSRLSTSSVGRSAAGELPLTVRAGLVGQAVVPEDRGLVIGG